MVVHVRAQTRRVGAVMGEMTQKAFFFCGGKIKCINHKRPIGWLYLITLNRLHSAPPAEAYLAPFIMYGQHPRPPSCQGRFHLTTTPNSAFVPKRMRELHNLDAARCFQGPSLIKNGTAWLTGGVLSKGASGRRFSWGNECRRGPKLLQLSH